MKKFRKVKFSEDQNKEIYSFREKLKKKSISVLYKELSNNLSKIRRISQTYDSYKIKDMLNVKSFYLVIALYSKIKSYADESYFLAEAREWIDTSIYYCGFTIVDLELFSKFLLDESTPSSFLKAKNIILLFLKDYKNEIYKDSKKEKKIILSILSNFFETIYKYHYSFLWNEKILKEIREWRSDLNDIFDVHELFKSLYPEKSYDHNHKDNKTLVEYSMALTSLQLIEEKDPTKKIKTSKNGIFNFDEYKGILTLNPTVSFITKRKIEISNITNSKYDDEINYLISKMLYIRKDFIKNKKIENSLKKENILISLTSLAEQIHYTFLKVGEFDFEPKNCSPASESFWKKLKPWINKTYNFKYISKIKVSFFNKIFQIWSNNDLGHGYKSNNDGLRNIIVHRNPMFYERYSDNKIVKEIENIFTKVINLLNLLIIFNNIFSLRDQKQYFENHYFSPKNNNNSSLLALKNKKTRQKQNIKKGIKK